VLIIAYNVIGLQVESEQAEATAVRHRRDLAAQVRQKHGHAGTPVYQFVTMMTCPLILALIMASVQALHWPKAAVSSMTRVKKSRELILQAKTRMPKFDSDDQMELQKMMTSNRNQARPRRVNDSRCKPSATTQTASSPVPEPASVKPKISPLFEPNENWRSALKTPYRPILKQGQSFQAQRKVPIAAKPVEIDEFDYDDFEEAMLEMETGEVHGGRTVKLSSEPVDHGGLHSGELIPIELFSQLRDFNASAYNVARIHQDINDVIILYADPRKSNVDYRTTLSQLEHIPRASLKVAIAAINCDDAVDLRKAHKKAPKSFPVLIDPTKMFMYSMKCRQEGRLCSCLALLEARSGMLLKLWYEGDWDPLATKDLLMEEITYYRASPRRFLEEQIGIR
jgi:hypothetical protein